MNAFERMNQVIDYLDYSYGWSAEAYDRNLSFDAEEGTINYFCPCKKAMK